MDIKKLAPWNWFKKEEAEEDKRLPVKHTRERHYSPLASLHHEIDRVFESAFQNFGVPAMYRSNSPLEKGESVVLKPSLDVAATEKEYVVTVEVPGVDSENVNIELSDDTLFVKGEKKLESEQKEKNFYRIERAYGSFQRVLTLPEDADKANISARFNNGVLTITLPRNEVSRPKGKTIDIQKAA